MQVLIKVGLVGRHRTAVLARNRKGHVARVTPLTRRRPIRRRTHGRWRCLPSGEWPGPRQSALARPRRSPAGDSTRPPDGTLFTLSPQCRPLALTSSSFGAPNRMASSLGLRAVAPARARVATQSSRSMVIRAAVSTPAPVVVKREGTHGAGPAIHPDPASPPCAPISDAFPPHSTPQTSSHRIHSTTSRTTSSRRSAPTFTSAPITLSASSSPSSSRTLTRSTARTRSPPTTTSTPSCPRTPTSTASSCPPTTSPGLRTIPTTSITTPCSAATPLRISSRCSRRARGSF